MKEKYYIIGGLFSLLFVLVIIFFVKNILIPGSFLQTLFQKTPPQTTYNPNPLVTNDPSYLPVSSESPSIIATSPQQGPLNAPVTLVEFSDLLCPYCAEMHKNISQLFLESKNNIRWVWKDVPVTSLHPLSRKTHIAARCAWKQKKFWPFIEQIFLSESVSLDISSLAMTAEKLNLKKDSFESCLNDKSVEVFIDFDIREAKALKVNSTPTLFILSPEGTILKRITGLISLDELKSTIQKSLPKNTNKILTQ